MPVDLSSISKISQFITPNGGKGSIIYTESEVTLTLSSGALLPQLFTVAQFQSQYNVICSTEKLGMGMDLVTKLW